MDGTSQFLLDLLSNSPFLVWMIYQHSQLRKDLAQQQEISRNEEKELRDRYQKVIDQYTTEREKRDEQATLERTTWLQGIENRITNLEKSIRTIYAAIKDLNKSTRAAAANVEELKIKEAARIFNVD